MTYFRSYTITLVGLTIVLLTSFGACGDDGGPNDPGDTTPTAVDTISPGAVSDLAVYKRFPQSITILWTAPGDDGDIGKASRYDIRYSDQPVTEQTWETAAQLTDEPRPKDAGLMQTMRVYGLEPSNDYHFAMKAIDEASNASGLSNRLIGSTLPEEIPPVITLDLTSITLNETSFMLVWTSPGDDGNEGQASQYDIRYSEGVFNTFDWETATHFTRFPIPKSAGEPDTVIISGLQAGTHYQFALKAADEVPNWSEMSSVAPGLSSGVILVTSKRIFSVGEHMVIVYKATADASCRLRIKQYQIGNCDPPLYGFDDLLVSEWLPTGTYRYVYDFYNEETGEYEPPYGFVLLCWGTTDMDYQAFNLGQ